MFGHKFCVFVAVIVYLENSGVYATVTKEQIAAMKEDLEPLILDCIKEFGITDEQFEAIKDEADYTGVDPCFVSCFFKKTEMISSDGMFDAEKAIELIKSYIDDEKDIAAFEKIKTDCVKVNEEEVSDGEKGCERAAMLFLCIKEHEGEVDFAS